MTVVAAVMIAIGLAFMPGTLITHEYLDNPFEIVVVGPGVTTFDLFGASHVLGLALMSVSLLAALLSVVLRLRRARGDERQQLKWFLFAAVPLTVLGTLDGLDQMVYSFTRNFMFHPVYILYSLGLLVPVVYVEVLALLLVPVFTYIAILRYNLYDIDIVINRTLVYGALTACVVAIYVLAVVALGALFQAQGNLAVSLSATGLVAVLFQPLQGQATARA